MEEYIVSIREFEVKEQILLYYELSTLRTFLFCLFLIGVQTYKKKC